MAGLGPTVLRDYQRDQLGFPLKGPDRYLKQGDGASLGVRIMLKEILKRHPVNRPPPFRKGNGGVKLSFESVPKANSIFRYLYENGTIDFISLRWGGQNDVVWASKDHRGFTTWGDQLADISVLKWLPIFLEGIREYEEPFRFLSIMGSSDLIQEGGSTLHEFAADLVPPFKKALDTREPTVVIVAVELMKHVLNTDPRVAETWIHYLGHFSQVLNLFLSKGYLVNLGYNSHQTRQIKESIHDVLVAMQENAGFDCSPLVRRHMRVDPIVTDESIARRTRQAEENPAFQKWKQYTLF